MNMHFNVVFFVLCCRPVYFILLRFITDCRNKFVILFELRNEELSGN